MTRDDNPKMRRYVRYLTVLTVVATTLFLAIRPAAAADKPKRVVGVSLLTMTHTFFIDMANGLKDEAAKNGIELIVTAGEMDVAKQKNQVADFIVKRVDAIVLAPCDSKAIGTSIIDANKAGIPVFTVDIACLDPNAKVVAHVATDNYLGGKKAAEAMIEAIGGNGKVAIIDHPEVESVLLRTKGFKEVIDAHNAAKAGKIDIVAVLPGGGAKEKAFKAAEDILQSYPDINGIFGINDSSATGAVAAIEKAGKKNIAVVGFDAQPEARQAIKDGKIYADPEQAPDKIGRTAIQLILKYMGGDDVPAQVLIPPALYRKADAEKDPSLK